MRYLAALRPVRVIITDSYEFGKLTGVAPLVAEAHAEQRAQRPRRRGRPKGVPFASRIDMAYEEATTFGPPPDTHTHLLIDTWYMAKRIWRAARRRNWDVSGGLKGNRAMRVIDTTDLL